MGIECVLNPSKLEVGYHDLSGLDGLRWAKTGLECVFSVPCAGLCRWFLLGTRTVLALRVA